MDLKEQPLKLYFIPYLAAGHMIPLCDMPFDITKEKERGKSVDITSNKIKERNNVLSVCKH